ncbi:MAG: cysteine--tRNA ligase [Minisyncoccia bacterium]
MDIHLYNSKSHLLEVFRPKADKSVGMYTCGPTVYSYVTIGNWRTYTLADFVYRALVLNGYKVQYIMNITDVGHLTGDNTGDADTGTDRLENASKKENKTVWDIATYYTNDFMRGYDLMHLSRPNQFVKATDHITEQIELIEKLEKNGLTYQITDGVYFDTVAYEAQGYTYGELSNLDHIHEGARVEYNTEKKNNRDFALWKFNNTDEKRQMEWDSPWGVGFPGWHIECSAMSMKYLGEQFDLHIGGEDLKSTHHPNEIAQSQGATGCAPFVNTWLHGAFLLVDGGRMGKSMGNAYTIDDIVAKGYSPMALRYFYLTGHYRTQINFTWGSLDAANNALQKLYAYVDSVPVTGDAKIDEGVIDTVYQDKMLTKINDDLDMPGVLAVMWEMIKDPKIEPVNKKATLLWADAVLGLGLDEDRTITIPHEVAELVEKREEARASKDFAASDTLRAQIQTLGYEVLDTAEGPKVKKL